jgi:hypothetical protein
VYIGCLSSIFESTHEFFHPDFALDKMALPSSFVRGDVALRTWEGGLFHLDDFLFGNWSASDWNDYSSDVRKCISF